MKKINIKDNILRYFGFSAIVLLVIVFTIMDSTFVGPANLKNLFSDSAPLMIMAAGMTLVLILGSIDLSLASVCSVCNVIAVRILVEMSASMGIADMADPTSSIFLVAVVAFGSAILFGLFAGFLIGVVHVKFKIPSFIASLGFMAIWNSAALLISPSPVSVSKVMWPAVDWAKITVFDIFGLPLIIAVAGVLIYYILQSRTTFGKHLMAVGGNETAARISGIPVGKIKITAFTLGGLSASLGGILLAAKLKSSAPTVGDPFTLLIVASVVLGGTALSGGRGSVLGTILGVFVVSIIRNGMNIASVDVFWQNIVFGIVILGSVALTVDRKTRNLIVK